MMSIGKIPYLNVEPFYALWPNEKGEFGKGNSEFSQRGDKHTIRTPHSPFKSITVTPRRLGELAEKGEVDGGVMSIYDYFRLSDQFEPIGDFGIAVSGPVKSVLLYSKGPVESLQGGRVGITPETSTAFRLLRLLLEVKYGVHPRQYLQGIRDGVDGRLVIGNEALKGDGKDFPFVMDLAEEWWDWRNLPFVFARWVMRRSLPVDRKWSLWNFLRKSFKEGMENLDEIAQRFSGDLGEAVHLKNYLENFIYRIGPKEEQGERKFKHLIEEYGIT